jgi:hypothetical protein
MLYIPAWIVALVTFPGVILHEISHRFFCDIFNVPVYSVRYFVLFSQQAGQVIFAKPDTLLKMFFIAIAPLIINSFVCMIFTFPVAATSSLGTGFIVYPTIKLDLFLAWIGYTAGFSAIPSNQDLAPLPEMAQSKIGKVTLIIFTKIFYLFNLNKIGPFFLIGYAIVTSLVLPKLFLS